MMIIYSKEKIKHDTDTDKLTLTQDISLHCKLLFVFT